MREIFEALGNAADGVFVVDEELRIQFWNESAEKTLGFGSERVVGRKCYQLLQGMDEESRLICKACCQVAQLALSSEPVSSYDVRVRTGRGDRRWLNMSILALKVAEGGDMKLIAHLFRDISQKKDSELLFRKILEIAQHYRNNPVEFGNGKDLHRLSEKLTVREREVLALLTRGLNTQEIAGALFISPNTVRNHVQNILGKLEVHSRMEAIAYAYRYGLTGEDEL